MKRRNVVLLPQAQADLRWIYDVVERRDGPLAAIKYIERIEVFCRGFDYAAERGARRDDVRPGLRVVGFERRVTVAFAVELNEVAILRIFYGGADWEREFDKTV